MFGRSFLATSRRAIRSSILLCTLSICLSLACRPRAASTATASISFDRLPPAAIGGAGETDTISGTVNGNPPGSRIVVYVYSRNTWYVQPLTIHPFTAIADSGHWSTATHLGSRYAAILIAGNDQPPNTLAALPPVKDAVVAVATAAGRQTSAKDQPVVHFSDYDWSVRQLGSDRHGSPHPYRASNVSVDSSGALHLRITKEKNEWTCSEVALSRSLGYGRYALSVDNLAGLEPAAVFDMFTWDQAGSDQDRREVDLEVTRWGDPASKNGEYEVQPFFRPTNTYRYAAPPLPLTFTLLWESAKVTFTTAKTAGNARAIVASHSFVTDIPGPQTESIHLNLCTFDYGKVKQQHDDEVVVKSFRYLP